MFPTMNKANRALLKEGARRMVGYSSAWQAHLDHRCMSHCWYCKQGVKPSANQWNWYKGIKYNRLVAAMFRHAIKRIWYGE